MSYRITFQPSGLRASAEEGETLLEASRRAGEPIESSCAGKGVCGKCAALVRSGDVSPQAAEELDILPPGMLADGYRLSCMCVPRSDCVVELPESSRRGRQVALSGDTDRTFTLNPAAVRYYVDAGPAFESSPVSDAGRVIRAAREMHGLDGLDFSIGALRSLPGALRDGGNSVTLTVLDGRRAVRVLPGYGGSVYGAAVDLGSTTIAAYLCDMETGRVVSTASADNPQTGMGEDVMSRIRYAMDNGAGGLRDAVAAAIDGVMGVLMEGAPEGVSRDDIAEVVVAGNTVMLHLLMGLDVAALGVHPFTPAVSGPVEASAGDTGLASLGHARVYTPPVIGGFVGADLVAAVMAAGKTEPSETVLVADLGTNGELALLDGERVAVASCATGPAFEGAQITHGMRGMSGAIEGVVVDPESLDVSLKVIGTPGWSRPGASKGVRGICGSGIVDAVARMNSAGVIDGSGRFVLSGPHDRLIQTESGIRGFVLAFGSETATGRPVAVTQEDVRAIQLAKAAVAAGVRILMSELGVSGIDRVLLAGAFGSYMEPGSASALGMFPGVSPERVRGIGNAALDGARALLLDVGLRVAAVEFARDARLVELSVHPDFQDRFMEAMDFPQVS